MPIILIIVFSLSVFMILYFSRKKGSSLRVMFVDTFLVFCVVVALLTEILSLFNGIDANSFLIAWSVVTVAILLFVVFTYRTLLFTALIKITQTINNTVKEVTSGHWVQFGFLCILLFGIVWNLPTLTNNYDSYTYHLPRIEQWIQNNNVNFYPTNNIRQLYLAPFSEYVILHLKLLSGGNLFNNTFQFVSYILVAIVTTLIAQLLSATKRQQLATFIISLTIPMALLQSVTTQTDLVVAFFTLTFIYYCIKVMFSKTLQLNDDIFLSVCAGLGILTKLTFFVFAFPFAIALVLTLVSKRNSTPYKFIPVILLILFVLDVPFFMRNSALFGSLLGPVFGSQYYMESTNHVFNIKVMLSNVIKNVSMHFVLPFERYNAILSEFVRAVVSKIGYNVNSRESNWLGMKYEVAFIPHHDTIGNFLHILLVAYASLVIILKRKTMKVEQIVFFACTLCTYFVFAFLLKWQPWQTRLDLAFFFLFAPLIALILGKNQRFIITVLLLLSGILLVYKLDISKPIFYQSKSLAEVNEQYAISYQDALKTNLKLNEYGISSVGLALGGDFPEWSYWLSSNGRTYKHVLFGKSIERVTNYDKNYQYKALIIDNGCLSKQELARFIKESPDIIYTEKYANNTLLVIFKQFQTKSFLY